MISSIFFDVVAIRAWQFRLPIIFLSFFPLPDVLPFWNPMSDNIQQPLPMAVRTLTLYVLSDDVFEDPSMRVPLNSFVKKSYPLLKNASFIGVKHIDKLRELSGSDREAEKCHMPCLIVRDFTNGKHTRSVAFSGSGLRMWFDKHAPNESGFFPFVPRPYEDAVKLLQDDERKVIEKFANSLIELDSMPSGMQLVKIC